MINTVCLTEKFGADISIIATSNIFDNKDKRMCGMVLTREVEKVCKMTMCINDIKFGDKAFVLRIEKIRNKRNSITLTG